MKTPWAPCKCGGRYSFETGQSEHENTPIAVYHTNPPCSRYLAADTAEEMVVYSEENRRAAGIGGSCLS